jgi:hypothetical protein
MLWISAVKLNGIYHITFTRFDWTRRALLFLTPALLSFGTIWIESMNESNPVTVVPVMEAWNRKMAAVILARTFDKRT